MNDHDRDSLRTRLKAGDPYQGESMPAADVGRIRARMRAGAADPRVRPSWMPASAAAAVVVFVALGTWAASRSSTTVEPLPLPLPRSVPATPDNDAVAGTAPDPVATASSPLAGVTAGAELAAVQIAPAPPESTESSAVAIATGHDVTAEHVATVVAADVAQPEMRRIQFTARRGTRIVWTLDPDFDPSTTRNDAPPARHQQGANDQW